MNMYNDDDDDRILRLLRSFAYYICIVKWLGVNLAPKNSSSCYICIINWPLLSPSSSEKFFPVLHLHYKFASSKSEAPNLKK